MNKIGLITLAISLGLALTSCQPDAASGQGGDRNGQGSASKKFGAINVEATLVRLGSLQVERTTAGSVTPVDLSQVASQVSGIVAKVYRKSGDWVTAGLPIVQLDDTQQKLALRTAQATWENSKLSLSIAQDTTTQSSPKLALQVQSAESTLASAKRNYEAMQALFKIKGASANDVDNAASQLSTAQANLESAKLALDQNKNADSQSLSQLRISVTQADLAVQQAQLNLDRMIITAPFSGQISLMNASPGANVSTSSVVFSLVSAERQVSYNAPPVDAPSLGVGTMLKFNYNGTSVPVRVNQSPSAPINGVVPMTATLFGGQGIPFGAVGTVFYTVKLAQGVIVPMTAIQSEETRNFVFAVVDGKARIQTIAILGESGSQAAVGGIDSGIQVISNPPPGLLDGANVLIADSQQRGQKPADNAEKPVQTSGQAPAQTKGGEANPKASGQNGEASTRPRAQNGDGTGNKNFQGRRNREGGQVSPAPSGAVQP